MNKFVFLLLVFAGSHVVCYAQDQESLEIAVQNLIQLLKDPDPASLEKITDAGLSYGHSSGNIDDQRSFIEALTRKQSYFISTHVSDQTVRIIGNTGLVRHKLSGEVMNNGARSGVNLGVLLVWQKQEDQWKLIARQAYRL